MSEIQHLSDKHCFTLATDGKEAVLEYRLLNSDDSGEPTGVNFTYTYVPPEMRGKGLAEALVRHGLKWARDHNYDIRATCWYVAKFLH